MSDSDSEADIPSEIPSPENGLLQSPDVESPKHVSLPSKGDVNEGPMFDQSMVDSGLSAEQIQMLKEKFKEVDASENGVLDQWELKDLWKTVFPFVSDSEAERITNQVFHDIDWAKDGLISFDELIRYLSGEDVDDDLSVVGDSELEEKPRTIRAWVWAVVDDAQRYSAKTVTVLHLIFSAFTQVAIVTSIANMMVETWPDMQNKRAGHTCEEGMCQVHQVESGSDATYAIEVACITIFTIEIVVRTASTPDQKAHWKSLFTWIDLLSVLPFYLAAIGVLKEGSQAESLLVLRVLRMAKLVRVLRVLKLGRKSEGIHLMAVALARSQTALVWLVLLMVMAMTLFSSLIYFVERDGAVFDFEKKKWYRPADSGYLDAGNQIFFQSIPDALWWAVVTLTTVGYGDMYPVTEMGKTVASICMLCGLLVVAYPITILCSVFQQAFEDYNRKKLRQSRQKTLVHRFQKTEKVPSEDDNNNNNNNNNKMTSFVRTAPPEDERSKRATVANYPTESELALIFEKLQRQSEHVQALSDQVKRLSSILCSQHPLGDPRQSCSSRVTQ